jgi:hypothetical protein
MKKYFIVLGLIVVAVITVLAFILNNNNSMLSGNAKDVVKVTISSNYDSLVVPKTLSSEENKIVLDILKSVKTTTVKHPNHLQGMYSERPFTIEVEYVNGTIDVIYATEIQVKYFRFLDSKGPDSDSGYIISSKMDDLFLFIKNKFNK